MAAESTCDGGDGGGGGDDSEWPNNVLVRFVIYILEPLTTHSHAQTTREMKNVCGPLFKIIKTLWIYSLFQLNMHRQYKVHKSCAFVCED